MVTSDTECIVIVYIVNIILFQEFKSSISHFITLEFKSLIMKYLSKLNKRTNKRF